MSSLDSRSFLRHTLPTVPYANIAKYVLPTYDISLVFAGKTRAQTLNRVLRKKTYVPNVLSYTTSKNSGEIILCPAIAKRDAKKYDMTYRQHLAFLFIHGLLHLKGHAHSTTMEKREREILARFIP